MTHHEGTFSADNGTRIYYQYWLPETQPVAAVLLCHGLGEHCGRYGGLAERLVAQGYAVYGLDHQGHGRSAGRRCYVDSFEQLLQPLKQYSDMVRQWQPGLPQVLIGHSMGGLIACRYLLEYQHELDAAVISAPAVKMPADISYLTILVGKLLSRALPWVGVSALDPEGVSRDPSVVRAYRDDPLVFQGKVTARLAAEILDSMQQVQRQASVIRLPLLLLQGSEDVMVDPSGAPALYETVSSEDKTIQIYPGLYHEVFNEPEREQVLGDVLGWLGERIGQLERQDELSD